MMTPIEFGEASVPEIGPISEKPTFTTYRNGYRECASQVDFPPIDSCSLDGDEDKDDLPVDDYDLVEKSNETDLDGTAKLAKL
jgi:hypothetical protein